MYLNNFVPLFAFEVVFFCIGQLAGVKSCGNCGFSCLWVDPVLYLLGLGFLTVKLWSMVMCTGHAMSLRHDGLAPDMSHVSSLEVLF